MAITARCVIGLVVHVLLEDVEGSVALIGHFDELGFEQVKQKASQRVDGLLLVGQAYGMMKVDNGF